MKSKVHLGAGLAVPLLMLALAGCGQQPPPPPPAESAGAPTPAPREAEPAVPAPPAPSEIAAQPPARVQPPPPRPKAAVKTEPIAAVTPREVVPPPPPAPPPPPPPPIVKTLPVGTPVDVIFLDGLSSETSQVGDTFRARVAQDIRVDGSLVVPAGSIAHGDVREVVPMKKIGGTAKVVFGFSRLDLQDGPSVDISASVTEEGKSQTKKDAATIGGAAAGGAILGKLIGKGTKEALIGAVVGAGVGTAVAAKNKGEQVEIPVGSQLIVSLEKAVDITIRH